MLHHYMTKYIDGEDVLWCESWIQLDLLGRCFCFSRRRIKLAGGSPEGEPERPLEQPCKKNGERLEHAELLQERKQRNDQRQDGYSERRSRAATRGTCRLPAILGVSGERVRLPLDRPQHPHEGVVVFERARSTGFGA